MPKHTVTLRLTLELEAGAEDETQIGVGEDLAVSIAEFLFDTFNDDGSLLEVEHVESGLRMGPEGSR